MARHEGRPETGLAEVHLLVAFVFFSSLGLHRAIKLPTLDDLVVDQRQPYGDPERSGYGGTEPEGWHPAGRTFKGTPLAPQEVAALPAQRQPGERQGIAG